MIFPFGVDDIPPEEIAYLSQRGIISRPFSQQHRAGPTSIVERAREFLLSRRVDAQALAADYPVEFPDVSIWQGIMDFGILSQMASILMARAGYGNAYIDPQLGNNAQGTVDHQMALLLYWYMKPDKDWRKHAESFAAVYKDSPAVLPVADCEDTGGLGKSALGGWLYKAITEFEQKTGVMMAIYTSPGFWNTNLPRTDWAKQRLLHVAHWTSAAEPTIPYDWSAIANPETWTIWQYTAKGPGALWGAQSRDIDLNRYHYSYEQFNRQFGTSISPPGGATPPPGGEDEMRFRVKIAKLNVRSGPGTNHADVGDVFLGDQFPILNVKAGTPVQTIWVQIKGGQHDGHWVCLFENGTYYLEPVA
jgi:GH25 family lysozyme M1 (1,4-beta-N-acetylmuramidase)